MLRDGRAQTRLDSFLQEADAFCRKRQDSIDLAAVEILLTQAGYSVDDEMARRSDHITASEVDEVKGVVHIVGAPRSGTSFLYYLLAHLGQFSYFSSDSHYRWHAYCLGRSVKRRFESLPVETLLEDTKVTRLRNDVLVPSEAEHIWDRSIPCYLQMGVHNYQLCSAKELDLMWMRENIADHCAVQGRPVFLSKSPFNSLRMAVLRRAFPGKTKFIHISRESADCAASISRNNFCYRSNNGKALSSLEVRAHFEEKIAESAVNNVYHVRYEEIMSNESAISDLINWINADGWSNDVSNGYCSHAARVAAGFEGTGG